MDGPEHAGQFCWMNSATQASQPLRVRPAGGIVGDWVAGIPGRLFAPVDISCLVFLRIVFGAVMLWEVLRYFVNDWIRTDFIEPVIHFTYFGFGWVKPWAGDGMYVHFAVLGLCAACIMVGFCYRIAAALFFVGFTHVFLIEAAYYLNHFYLICLLSFLMIFIPCERSLSIDAWRRPELRSDVAPAWTLWLLRAQISIVYFYGGVAKINADWLRGEPMRTWLHDRSDFPVLGAWFHEEWMVYFFVLGGLLLDLLIVPFLLWRRTRIPAFLAGAAFHLMNARLFSIGIFPWLMLGALLIFFPPDTPRRIAVACGLPWTAAVVPTVGAAATPLSRRQRLIATLLALYMLAQILIPLRHFLYPGDVSWTAEGHRFSWRMKLREKHGTAKFTVTDPKSGKNWAVDLDRYLDSEQRGKMSTNPHMILQFSHFLADQKKLQGYDDVEVRVRAMVSLNGRKEQLLVDPTVDLAKERESLLPLRWIMPLTEPLRKHGSEPEGRSQPAD